MITHAKHELVNEVLHKALALTQLGTAFFIWAEAYWESNYLPTMGRVSAAASQVSLLPAVFFFAANPLHSFKRKKMK